MVSAAVSKLGYTELFFVQPEVKVNGDISPDQWPPNSPDMNPVDYKIWTIMQQRVYQKRVNDRDVDELCQRLLSVWHSIGHKCPAVAGMGPTVLNSFIHSFNVGMRRLRPSLSSYLRELVWQPSWQLVGHLCDCVTCVNCHLFTDQRAPCSGHAGCDTQVCTCSTE